MKLRVPSRDHSIGHRQVSQCEQPRAVIDVVHVRSSDVPQDMVPEHLVVGGPEQGKIGLLGRAAAVQAGSQGLDLVIGRGVPLARERRWRRRAKL